MPSDGMIVKPKKAQMKQASLIPVLVVGVIAVGYISYTIYQNMTRPAPEPPGKRDVVVVEKDGAKKEVQILETVTQNADQWKNSYSSSPHAKTINGEKLIPKINVYQDRDVFIPLRTVVKQEDKGEETSNPFWKKEEVKEQPLTD